MPTKEGWTHDRDHDKVTLGRKQYRNMEEWSRPCAICGTRFSIFTRTGAEYVNSSFGLITCKEHRGIKPEAGSVVDYTELENLRAFKSVTEEELAGVYMHNRELQAQVDALTTRLAQYELQPAMEKAQKEFPWS